MEYQLFPDGNFKSGTIFVTSRDRDRLEAIGTAAYRYLEIEDALKRLLARSRQKGPVEPADRIFPARLTHAVIGDLNEITAGEQWTYPWAEEVHEWDSMAQVVTAALKTNGRTSKDDADAEDEDRFATNMLEGRTPAQLEKYVANCPAPDTGDTAVTLNFKRQPLPPGTPVWIRPVSTDDGTRFIIVGLRGAYPHLCGYCKEPAE